MTFCAGFPWICSFWCSWSTLPPWSLFSTCLRMGADQASLLSLLQLLLTSPGSLTRVRGFRAQDSARSSLPRVPASKPYTVSFTPKILSMICMPMTPIFIFCWDSSPEAQTHICNTLPSISTWKSKTILNTEGPSQTLGLPLPHLSSHPSILPQSEDTTPTCTPQLQARPSPNLDYCNSLLPALFCSVHGPRGIRKDLMHHGCHFSV